MVHDDWAFACVSDLLKAWNRRDWSAFRSLHTMDVVYESPHHVAVVGRTAVVRRYQIVAAAVPDLYSSELRLLESCRRDKSATFSYVQTGSLPDEPQDDVRRSAWSPFVVRTQLFVRFDDDGRIAALRTCHP